MFTHAIWNDHLTFWLLNHLLIRPLSSSSRHFQFYAHLPFFYTHQPARTWSKWTMWVWTSMMSSFKWNNWREFHPWWKKAIKKFLFLSVSESSSNPDIVFPFWSSLNCCEAELWQREVCSSHAHPHIYEISYQNLQ